jgi:hypothetical protein
MIKQSVVPESPYIADNKGIIRQDTYVDSDVINLENKIIEIYDTLDADTITDPWHEKIIYLSDMLLDFFRMEESVNNKLPFVSVIESDDKTVSVVSWYTKNGGNKLDFDSLIQYRGQDNKLKTEKISEIIRKDKNLDKYRLVWIFTKIVKLRDNVYLLEGDTNSSYGFITVEIRENNIAAYRAFDGDSMLKINYNPWVGSTSVL